MLQALHELTNPDHPVDIVRSEGEVTELPRRS
jgi:hypothetical protein